MRKQPRDSWLDGGQADRRRSPRLRAHHPRSSQRDAAGRVRRSVVKTDVNCKASGARVRSSEISDARRRMSRPADGHHHREDSAHRALRRQEAQQEKEDLQTEEKRSADAQTQSGPDAEHAVQALCRSPRPNQQKRHDRVDRTTSCKSSFNEQTALAEMITHAADL